ncbi:CDT1-like protein a, chloroplastic [Cornus florida]|uniref:CDT1-like protein a, chloroplastic n=1 Tax=Cornus florida TaxID=4283 RepID=UPI002897E4FD|nr:CDT1-like protein a, chloroplastic [Cornus florida]
MEQRKCEEREQNVFDCKSQNIIPGVEKSSTLSPGSVPRPGIVGTQHLETGIASLTPEKTNKPSHIKQREEVAELPEKYRTIAELFDRMTCSLRLLSLRKKSPTFGNISTQVELLTGRNFSYKHLAQIKYILPEAVETAKILIYDEKTLCMKPDIKITLLFDVVDGHHEFSTFMALHRVFASRLLIFSRTHPEGCEIPEAILPELFNQRSDAISKVELPVDSSTESQSISTETGLLLSSSHLNPSFSRHFSLKAVAVETDKSQLVASPVPLSSVTYDWLTNQDMGSGKQKKSPDLSLSSKSTLILNPLQLTYTQCCVSSTASESTPMKLASEDDSLVVETPAQLTPKRSMPSCDDKVKTTAVQKGTACHMSAKRSLHFSLPEGEESASNLTTDEIEQCKIRNTIPQTVKTKGTFVEENITCSATLLQKVEEESNGCTFKDHKMNQTGSMSHQQMSACLSDLVALIHNIFQSVNCSSITREELMHKIIMKNCDIVESREVEEQIELLEKLVPDWICKKLAPSGDVLYNIKKVSDLNSIRERLISM